MSYSPVAEVRVARLSKRHCYKLPRCKGLNIGETNRFVPVGAGNPKPCEHVPDDLLSKAGVEDDVVLRDRLEGQVPSPGVVGDLRGNQRAGPLGSEALGWRHRVAVD
eukprot:1190901-Prorocentrum_minimum.AAC.2